RRRQGHPRAHRRLHGPLPRARSPDRAARAPEAARRSPRLRRMRPNARAALASGFDPSHAPVRMSGDGGRILVVDDEANAREALVTLLSDDGYETMAAADGLEALEVMTTFEPEVVLTDLKMPRLDGLGLLERGKKAHPCTAFVVMTAFGSIDTAIEAIKRGAENYVTKPL